MPLDASCTSSTVMGCVANLDGDAIRLNLDLNQCYKIPKICLQNQKRNLEDCLGGATGGDLLVDIVSKRCTLSDRDILDGSWVWDWGKLGFGESSNQITNLMRELMLWKLTRIILIFIVLIALCRV